ncbi:hypothetical protein [Curtobacterium sp. CFBP9011]|uniref:hypothetical protein n=1 Tax=Curtobacterium sp. CFBP9011 TaxID=3096530 RepID=UPI002A6A196D|nr:hypothetical protein [Curtobacterium sp. CFBP9011]MDY1003637.1 hypothetical protein [Curtobacterium sp. CFBP9011]
MAGLVLLVVVAAGAVAQWSAPDGGTSASAPDPSSDADDTGIADDAGMSIGHGFIPDEPTTPATDRSARGRSAVDGGTTLDDGRSSDVAPATGVDNDGAGSPSSDPTGTTSVVDAANGLPVDAAQAVGPWWRRALPIAGDLVPIRGEVRGNVRLEVVGEQVVQVVLTGVQVTASPDPTGSTKTGSTTTGSTTTGSAASTRSHIGAVRVELSSGDVIGTERAQWTGADVPADFGSFTPDGEHPVLVIVDPQDLPPVVHSVLLVDADTGDLLGGAELLPVF